MKSANVSIVYARHQHNVYLCRRQYVAGRRESGEKDNCGERQSGAGGVWIGRSGTGLGRSLWRVWVTSDGRELRVLDLLSKHPPKVYATTVSLAFSPLPSPPRRSVSLLALFSRSKTRKAASRRVYDHPPCLPLRVTVASPLQAVLLSLPRPQPIRSRTRQH